MQVKLSEDVKEVYKAANLEQPIVEPFARRVQLKYSEKEYQFVDNFPLNSKALLFVMRALNVAAAIGFLVTFTIVILTYEVFGRTYIIALLAIFATLQA